VLVKVPVGQDLVAGFQRCVTLAIAAIPLEQSKAGMPFSSAAT